MLLSASHNANLLAILRSACVELYFTISRRKERVIFSHANVRARMELRTTLTNNDAARLDCLTTKGLYAQAFAFAIASVTGTTTSFFVCH